MIGVTQALRHELERMGATFNCMELPGLSTRKAKLRKSKNGLTQPQRFFEWYENLDCQKELTSKDIYTAIGLTKEQFRELKRSNQDVNRTLTSMKISGKNKYIKNGGKSL